MNLRLSALFIVAIFAGSLDAQKSKPSNAAHVARINYYDIPDRAALYNDYLKVSYLHARGSVDEALKSYETLLTKKPPVYFYDGYIRALADAGNYAKITKLYDEKKTDFIKHFGNNLELNMLFAQAFLGTNQDKKAETLFTELVAQHPNNPQICYYTAICYLKSNNTKAALPFLQSCIANNSLRSKHYLFLFLQSKAYLQANMVKESGEAIDKSIELFPRFDRGILFKAMLMEQQGKTREAIDGYKQFLDLAGRDISVEKQLTQLLFAQERFGEAAEHLKRNPHDDPAYFFDLALTQMRAQQYTEALSNVDRAVSKQPEFDKARLLKAELLLNLGRTDDVLNYMQGWVSNNPNNDAALRAFLLLRKTSIGLQRTIKTLVAVAITAPTQLVHAALGDLYCEAKQYSDSIEQYKKVLDLTPDEQARANVQFHICCMYLQSGDTTNLEKTCQQLIADGKAHGALYNLLAYHYSKKTSKLQAALQLAERALALEPKNHAFLDTKGCILYKLGKKNEAITTLQSALTQSPGDKTIIKHLEQARR